MKAKKVIASIVLAAFLLAVSALVISLGHTDLLILLGIMGLGVITAWAFVTVVEQD